MMYIDERPTLYKQEIASSKPGAPHVFANTCFYENLETALELAWRIAGGNVRIANNLITEYFYGFLSL
jgi:hypothetical protein